MGWENLQRLHAEEGSESRCQSCLTEIKTASERQIIQSIVSNRGKRMHKPMIASNACYQEALTFISTVEQIDETLVSEVNLNK